MTWNERGEHVYLSTGCLHGEHDYCKSMTGQQGEKRPGRCKFCDAQCVCECHDDDAALEDVAWLRTIGDDGRRHTLADVMADES